jgi:stage II sporulation protein AA (anti-sigma F factor antagonist)
MNNLVTGASVNFLFDQYTKITDNLESMVEGLNLDGLSDAEKRKKIDMFAFGMTEEEYEAIQNNSTTGTAGGHSFEVPEEQTHASYGFTEAMRTAAETFWDQLRDDGMFSDAEWDEFEKAFENNPEQWDKINELIDDNMPRECAIDLSGLTFMDSSGIAVIISTGKKMRTHGGIVLVENASEQPQKVLEAAGIGKLLAVSSII